MAVAAQKDEKESEIVIAPTILGYELDSDQNVVVNYLVPSLGGCILYILNFACDFTITYRHYRDGHSAWGGITIFFMYLPIIGSYVATISSWELWPDYEGCTMKNVKWALLKTVQHLFFPIWSMWRHAGKIFWSIEDFRSVDEDEKIKISNIITAPKTIELYYFLQGYLQAAPQILFQLHLLMRYVSVMDKQTVDALVFSVAMSLAQMAKTTCLYQRFKSQKISGKPYPWFKPYKIVYGPQVVDQVDAVVPNKRCSVVYRCRSSTVRSSVNESVELRKHKDDNEAQKRRSSDFYERPTSSVFSYSRDSLPEADRETSIVDGPKRIILHGNEDTQTDSFNPKRLFEIKGLLDDDMIGKSVSFLWWFCFLIARMLTISSFGYFYPKEVTWLLSCHFILVVALLFYDVRHDEVRRAKAIFFIFIGYVYLFCLIEFKIIFKKARFMYYGFFSLVFVENVVMIYIWWYRDAAELENNWWYNFIFYVVIWSLILSFCSMMLYIHFLKPKKVIVEVSSK